MSADKKVVPYQFLKGEENYTFTLHVDRMGGALFLGA